MVRFPTYKEMGKMIANEILDGYIYKGKTLRAWIDVLAQTQWIPVSERLPNRDEYIKDNGLFIVSDGNRSYSEWFDICDTQMFGEPTMTGFRVDHAVTAWMPLPEPYKADKE